MILSLIVLLIVLGVVYIHWLQGLFSGVISLGLAALAAALAVGYHEAVVASLLGGKAADSAGAMVLCATFAAVYGIGRVVFDMLVPGNVRLPLYVDKVGGAACGLGVGVLAGGTFATAAQLMPLGPTVAMHDRYELSEDQEKQVTMAGKSRMQDAMVYGPLAEDAPDPSKELGLWVNADRMMLDFAAFQSKDGALAGPTAFRDRHPDFLRELFFARLGIEHGAKHSALNVGGKSEVAVDGVFAPAELRQLDGESPQLRNRTLPPLVKADANRAILVVRVSVKRSAADTDGKFRFSPGAVRLVADGKTHYPVGTLHHPGHLLLATRMDDYLVAAPNAAELIPIDLVFVVPRAEVAPGDPKEPLKLRQGVFVEVKRYGRVDLAEKDATPGLPPPLPPGDGGMLRKTPLLEKINLDIAKQAGGAAE